MRKLLFPCLALLVAAASCGKDDPVSPGPGSNLPGTPLSAIGAIEQGSPLLWSGATNEVVAVASFNDPNPNALIAISAATTNKRTLDVRPSSPLALSENGYRVFYTTFDVDSTAAWVQEMTGLPSLFQLQRCDGSAAFGAAPSTNTEVVAVRSNCADSMEIIRISVQERDMHTNGWPLAFSPDGNLLLKKEASEGWEDAVTFNLTTKITTPAGLGVLDSMAAHEIRWDAAGLQVLYVSTDQRRLVLRNATAGTTQTLYSAPDSILPYMDWAKNGHKIAFWTRHAVAGGGFGYELRFIPNPTPVAAATGVVATTAQVGHVALAEDGAGAAYVVDRRLYRTTLP